MDDNEARKIIKRITGTKNINEIQGFKKEERDKIIKRIKAIVGISIRQIARITGLSNNLIFKL